MAVKFSVMVNGMYSTSEIPALACRVEEYGFDEFHIADDLLFRPAWPLLFLAAQATKTIRLGPFIVTPQLAHPVYHASNLAALDELSNGRAICGVGRGGFNSLVQAPRPKNAIAMVREGCELMRHVLARTKKAFNGEYFQAEPELLLHYPVERPEIPLYIGSWGPKMARMAGTVAAGLKADCVADPAYLRLLHEKMLEGARQAKRDPNEVEMIVGPLCSISSDKQLARRTMAEMLALLQPFLAPMNTAAGLDMHAIQHAAELFNAGDKDAAVNLISDTAIAAFSLTGSPDDIIPRIQALIDAGADNIAFGTPLGPDPNAALSLLANEVLPYFR